MRLAVLAILGALLGACTTPVPTADITLFHKDLAAAPRAVTITALDPEKARSPFFAELSARVAAGLNAQGFTAGSEGKLIARLDWTSEATLAGVGSDKPRTSVGVGVGGGIGGGGGLGISTGFSFPLGGNKDGRRYRHQLRLELRESGRDVNSYEASVVSVSEEPSPAVIMPKLVDILFEPPFPGASGTTRRVELKK